MVSTLTAPNEARRNRLGDDARFDRELQHELAPRGTEARAKARHLRGVDRRRVREVLRATEVPPVRILDPAFDDLLIGQVEGVLQVVQPNHQTDRHPGSAFIGVQRAEALDGGRPVDLSGELEPGVALIEQVDQLLPKQLQLGLVRGQLGLHAITRYRRLNADLWQSLRYKVPR